MTRTLLLLVTLASAHAAPRWEVRYFYDKDRSSLDIVDLCFPSAERGIAAGIITGHGEDARGVAAVTSDGGRNWSLAPLKDTPQSLFFLNDSLGWMVTGKACGRPWRAAGAGARYPRPRACCACISWMKATASRWG